MPSARHSLRLLICAAALVAAVIALPAAAHAEPIFSITGGGWGHGIGLTQYGAYGYALQGRAYDWILGHYFQGTTLATRVELTVMVDLDKDKAARSSWRIASGSSEPTLTVTDYTNGARSVEVTPGVSVWITFKSGGAILSADSYNSTTKVHSAGSVIATFPASVIAATGPAADSRVRIYGGTGPFPTSHTNVEWRGRIRFVSHSDHQSSGHAIDYVPMEQYLRGVVPRESPSSWHMEALKAQAVAARSYAYDAASSGSVLWCTTQSQVYNGAGDSAGTHESARTDTAVAETANQFVTYDSRVVQTFFCSSSGGRTANIEDVWLGSTPREYYSTVEDADDPVVNGVHLNTNYKWSLADMTGTTLGGKIRGYDNGSSNTDPLDYSAPSPATLVNITLDAGTSGFVRNVTLKWSNGASYTITGSKFRTILDLKSTAFKVKVTDPTPPPTRFQDSDARPLWTGAWSVLTNSSGSGGSYHRSSTAGATWTVMFKGSTVAWIGTKTDHAGKAEVSLDGTLVATVDLYSSTTKYKQTIWSKTTGLSADTTHTLVVKVLGTHRSAAHGSCVYVDAVDVTGSLLAVPRPPAWKRYDQGSSKVKYAGTWKTSSISGMYGGTHAYSSVTSSTATFTFTGTQVRWIGKKGSNYGKAWVSVDASAPVLVDLYASSSLYQQRLFQSAMLEPGTHTLTVTVAGTKNTKSTYRYVDVDAFEALEPVVP